MTTRDEASDETVLARIQRLVADEHRMFNDRALDDAGRDRLQQVEIELDQCWDLLRQRRALRAAGADPNQAHVRPPEIVENYEQ